MKTVEELSAAIDDILTDLNLEVVCPSCHGRGFHGKPGRGDFCGECKCLGIVTTPLGDKVLEFVQKRFQHQFVQRDEI